MKKLLALAFLAAAAAFAPTTSFAHNGMHGGGFHGHAGARAFHGFGGSPARHAFPFRRGFVTIGAAVPLAYYYSYPALGYTGGQPMYLYCQNPVGYYPEIQYCPIGWQQVLP